MSSYPLPKGLSQLDPGGVLKNSHEIQAEALRTIDVDNLVNAFFTRADVTYNGSGSATAASFYYDKNNQIEVITFFSDISGSLNNKYWTLDGPNGAKNKYYIWYNVDNTGTDPAIVGREGIEIPISTNDDADIVSLATRLALNLNTNIQTEFTVKNINNTLRLVAKLNGQVIFLDINSGFTFFAESIGITELVKTIELPYENGIKYVYNTYEKTFTIFQDISTVITKSLMIGTDDGQVTGDEYVFVNNKRLQILAAEDREQELIYADFGTKDERIIEINYSSNIVNPGITAKKSINYTLVGDLYRRDNIIWTLV